MHEGWLDFSMLFFCRVKEKNFLLSPQIPKLDPCVLNQSFVFGENKKTIEDFYSVEEEDLKNFFERMNKKCGNIDNRDNIKERNRKKR